MELKTRKNEETCLQILLFPETCLHNFIPVLPSCHVTRKHGFLRCSKIKVCFLETKIDTENNASFMAKLRNIGENFRAHRMFLERCFLVLPGLYYTRVNGPLPNPIAIFGIKAWQNEETCFCNCFLVLPYLNAARKHGMFLPCSRSKVYFLETKIDAGNNASRVEKLGNIGKTSTRY